MSSRVPVPPPDLERLRDAVDRLGYLARHQGLALSLGVGGRVWSLLLNPRARPLDARAIRVLRRRLRALSERDLANAASGYYPRELPHQFPLCATLPSSPTAPSSKPCCTPSPPRHEPYYKGYLRDDLAELLGECGFEVEHVESHLVSKVVVGRKPRRRRQRG